MYAVIETAGKQYRVELGTQLEIDRMDVEPGQTIQLERVLLIADGETSEIGRPTVEGATVAASVIRQDRGEKIVVFKYGPKTRRRVKQGHRQDLTVLRISDISWGGKSAAADAEAAQEAERQAADAAARDAQKRAAADKALAAKLAKDAEPAAEASARKDPGDKATKATPKSKTSGTAKAAPKSSASTTKSTGKPARKPAARTQAPAPDAPKRRTTKKDE